MTIETIMFYMLVVLVGLSSIITFRHIVLGIDQKAYDNWLLPVTLAATLQIYENTLRNK